MRESRLSKWLLAAYFCLFLFFLYGPMLVMAVLSFQGPQGGSTFPIRGFSFGWWKDLVDGPHSDIIRETAVRSIWLALVTGAVTAVLAFTLSMAYRRRFRGDGALFYLVMLALMTPGILLSLGTSLFWQFFGKLPGLWHTALGTDVVWALPFAFLVMVAVWNRYDVRVEEAARDLGANTARTFREVTLPIVWTGIFGSFLFGFTLSWNEFDRVALVLASGQETLPVQIFGLVTGAVIQPDLYALGVGTTAFSLMAIGIFLVIAALRVRRQRGRAESVQAEIVREELTGEVAGGEPGPPDAAGLGARAQ